MDPWGLWCIPLPKETKSWNISRGKPKWILKSVVFTNLSVSGTALWQTKTSIWEEHDERTRKLCWKCDECDKNCGFRIEYGEWVNVQKSDWEYSGLIGRAAWCFTSGANPQKCSHWFTFHPETGKQIEGRF